MRRSSGALPSCRRWLRFAGTSAGGRSHSNWRKIDQMEPDSVLDAITGNLGRANVMPLPVHQIVYDVLRGECARRRLSITRCTMLLPAPAILVRPLTSVVAHRSAVNAHPDRKFGMILKRFGNLKAHAPVPLHCGEETDAIPSPVGSPNQLFVRRFHGRGQPTQLQ